MATTTSIDFTFIEKYEGGVVESAYVPVCTAKSVRNINSPVCYQKSVGTVIANSGVTIAAGLDLGQQSEKGLRAMHIPDEIIAELKPYISLRKDAAKKKLESLPLKLSSQQVRVLDNRVKENYVSRLRQKYNDASNVDFFDLPLEAQTAIFSFYYQNGWKNSIDFHERYYSAVTKQDWGAAQALLLTSINYKNRRLAEAELFKKLIIVKGDFNIPGTSRMA